MPFFWLLQLSLKHQRDCMHVSNPGDGPQVVKRPITVYPEGLVWLLRGSKLQV